MTFSELVRYYRKKAGLTQAQLAELTGYTDKSSIAKIETGAIDPPQTKIKALADAFHISPAAFFREYPVEMCTLYNVCDQTLAEKINRLDDEDKSTISNMADVLLMKDKYKVGKKRTGT